MTVPICQRCPLRLAAEEKAAVVERYLRGKIAAIGLSPDIETISEPDLARALGMKNVETIERWRRKENDVYSDCYFPGEGRRSGFQWIVRELAKVRAIENAVKDI